MGLAEKRAMLTFQQNQLEPLKAKLFEAIGFEVPLEIDFESLTIENGDTYYAEGMTKVFFEPLTAACKNICSDELGKNALKSGLKKIIICNKSGHYSPEAAFKLEAGTLSLDHHTTTNLGDVLRRTEFLQNMLEKAM